MICSFIEGVPVAKKLNQMGISAVIVYYRLKKRARFPAPQDDLACAVKELIRKAEEFNVDAAHYSVWGASAGGHLAASFGTDHMGYVKYGLPKPAALILSYPVISMRPALTHKDTHDNLLGKSPSPELEESVSVDEQITKNHPPVYIWCGDADKTVMPENTVRMEKVLEEAGVPLCCEIFPGVGHGVGPGSGTAAEGWIDRAVDFWKSQYRETVE